MERESKKMKREFITAAEGDGEERGISNLPLIMKELVFSKLPVESICSSRVVCKEWNFILSSQRFLSSLSIQNPWLLMCGKEMNETWVCMAYCFSAQKWMTLPLCLPPDLDISFSSGAGQGLLLFEKASPRQLFVCNPLMRSYAEIEMDLTDKFIAFLQVGNKEPYLVVCSTSGYKFSFKIYHHFQDSWRIKFQITEETTSNISVFRMDEMVECNDVLFMRRISLETIVTIVGYKIKADGFSSPVTIAPLSPQMVKDLTVCNMVSYGSSILVVGIIQELDPFFFEVALDLDPLLSFNPLSTGTGLNKTGIVIWELFQDEENELIWKWKEFARMPPHSLPQYVIEYLNDYAYKDWFYGDCACVGDYLCFNAASVFAYNLKCGFWQRLPPHKSHYSNQKMISFEPKLYHYQFPRKSSE
ncbi:hypothetical protein SUGI_0249920 [Cryptomeria japonica]|uniref:uncharacterized protein LOC131067176 n=1 Tax=Cryptomeria japonica TaxID=3369 RepID=UPI002408E92E|nr:uncharacterized protein LOC131067176 [Cryptomeria japonica]GLJ15273.1 hypothetical protein SUGI_0249920 [Cryptomeria japonica]